MGETRGGVREEGARYSWYLLSFLRLPCVELQADTTDELDRSGDSLEEANSDDD